MILSTSHNGETLPFDGDVHLRSAQPTAEEQVKVDELRSAIASYSLYAAQKDWIDDMQLLRFLVARKFDVPKSLELLKGALKWREVRKPDLIEMSHYWPDKMSKESETGKIYCPGHDKWGRSVLVFDNTVENTKSIDDQMIFLAWNLEFAIKLMKPNVDKYLVFMHLGNFSFFNTPPLAATKETINMLCNCFPERLGHCIAYQPPAVFKMFFNSVKGFLDAKTASKMVFVIGDVSAGSENDRRMRELVGDDWKALVGADQPVLRKGNSPGYDHSKFWPTVMSRLAALNGQSDDDHKKRVTVCTGDSQQGSDSTGGDSDSGYSKVHADSAADGSSDEVVASVGRSARLRYRMKQSFSEVRAMNSSGGDSDSDSGGGPAEEGPAVDEVDYLLTDLLHFLTLLGLAVLLFEWGGGSVSS